MKKILFDDFQINQEPDMSSWAYVCKNCAKSYGFNKNNLDNAVPAHAICGIKGCNNEADFYLDLPGNIKKPKTGKPLEIPLDLLTDKTADISKRKGTLENEEYWKLNKKPLKLYFGRQKAKKTEDYDEPYFNWQNKREYLSNFVRTHHNPWMGEGHYPDFIHGVKNGYTQNLYIEITKDEKVNVYELHKK